MRTVSVSKRCPEKRQFANASKSMAYASNSSKRTPVSNNEAIMQDAMKHKALQGKHLGKIRAWHSPCLHCAMLLCLPQDGYKPSGFVQSDAKHEMIRSRIHDSRFKVSDKASRFTRVGKGVEFL